MQNEVEEINSLVKDGFATKILFPKPPRIKGIFNDIFAYDDKVVASCLGNFGIKLKNFLNHCDIEHPLFPPLFSGIIGNISDEMSEALVVAEKFQNLRHVLNLLSYNFNERQAVKELIWLLTNPPVYLLKTREFRDCVRENGITTAELMQGKITKKDFVIFDEVKITLRGDWLDQPNTMKHFVRCNNFHLAEAEKLKERQKKLAERGMSGVSDHYKSRAAVFVSKKQDLYCGFYRLSLQQVSTIIGKVHGYEYYPTNISNLPVLPIKDPKYRKLCEVLIPNSSFVSSLSENVSIFNKTNNTKASLAEIVDSTTIGENKVDLFNNVMTLWSDASKTQLFQYKPRIYPIHAFSPFLSKHVRDTVDTLENFPDMDHKPLFDNYYIIVPSVDIVSLFYQTNLKKYCFNMKEKTISLESKDEASFLLDSYLIKNSLVSPAILGKKNNDYYFIDYWRK